MHTRVRPHPDINCKDSAVCCPRTYKADRTVSCPYKFMNVFLVIPAFIYPSPFLSLPFFYPSPFLSLPFFLSFPRMRESIPRGLLGAPQLAVGLFIKAINSGGRAKHVWGGAIKIDSHFRGNDIICFRGRQILHGSGDLSTSAPSMSCHVLISDAIGKL